MSGTGRIWRKYFTRQTAIVFLTFYSACQAVPAEGQNPVGEKFSSLKAGKAVYSNVTVTAVTATDLYFTYSGGMANVKLEQLSPELQKEFHFDPQKARDQETQEQKATASYRSWNQSKKTRSPVSGEQAPYISVQASDATVKESSYDPIYGRPSDLTDYYGARFGCAFSFDCDFTISPVTSTNAGKFAFRIDATKISIGMEMEVTHPSTPPEKMQIHLEGHRRIYEHFYALAPKAAERAANVLGNGLRIHPPQRDRDSARAWFLETAKANAEMEYYRYTKQAANAASRYYDRITDRGSNLVDTDHAVEEAIKNCEVPIPDPSSDAGPGMWVEGATQSKTSP